MARILYAWELGGDYGHIGSFMPLALELREQGHEVIFVLRDLSNAETVVSKYKFSILQAPIWTTEIKGLPDPPLNYTEIILRYGFVSKPALSALNRAWLGLFALIKPDFIIADHSPVALFSARAVGLPRAVYGTGFCSPPHISPMPNMRPWAKVPQKRLEESDKHVLAIANSLLIDMQSKAPPLQAIADLFKVDVDFLCTFPEMDHYPQRKNSSYWGPVFNVHHGKAMAWAAPEVLLNALIANKPSKKAKPSKVDKPSKLNKPSKLDKLAPILPPRKRIFVYIKSHYKNYEKILDCLKAMSTEAKFADVLVFSPGISKKLMQDYQGEYLRFATEPIQLASILPNCDLAICHAGHGTIAACLMAGVPLLLLPMQLEQFLASMRLQQLGAAEVVHLEAKIPPDYHALICNLLSNDIYKQKAKAFAAHYSKFDQENQFKAMANKISQLLKK